MRRIRATRRRARRTRRTIALAVIAAALAVIATGVLGGDKPPAGSAQMPQNPPNLRQIPGGPLYPKQPDLLVEKIDVSFSQTACNDDHAGIMPVTVTIKNVGFTRGQ